MNASDVIRDNLSARPGAINKKDNKNSKARKVSEQNKYNDEISSLLRALIGSEVENDNGVRRRELESDFVVELMALTDAEYRKRITSFMKFFNSVLKHVESVNRAVAPLSRDQVIRKVSNDQTYFLSKGWGNALVNAVRFFLAHTIKLLTINRKKTRAPTVRNQYRFRLNTAGKDLLNRLAELTQSSRLVPIIEEAVESNRMSLVVITTIIRYMIKYAASDHLAGVITNDRLRRDILDLYTYSGREKKDGTRGVVLKPGKSKVKAKILDDVATRDKIISNLRDFTIPKNNEFLRDVMDLGITATAFIEYTEKKSDPDHKIPSKVVISFGDGEPTTIGELIQERRNLQAQMQRELNEDDENVISSHRGGSAKDRKVRMSAQARIIASQKKLKDKTGDADEAKQLAVASNIAACLGAPDPDDATRVLSRSDIDSNKDILERVKRELDDNDEIKFIKKFIADVVKKDKDASKNEREGPARTTKRGAQQVGRARQVGRR